ncbi:hypothetical protein G6514_009743 [Epicoccum nigrum]|nr:hypothetical protein G6514_009743 [Epicoccum nigrum]
MASQAGKRTIKLTERGSQFSELLLGQSQNTNNSSQSTQSSSSNRRSTQSRRSTNRSSSNLSSAHPSRHQGSSVVPETPRRDGNIHRSGTSIERELDEILANANPDDNPDDDEYVDDNDANDHASDDHAEDVDGAEPESEDSDVPNNISIFDALRW